MDRTYLGDGVYVEWAPPCVVRLTTDSGRAIYLTPEAYGALVEWAERSNAAMGRDQQASNDG